MEPIFEFLRRPLLSVGGVVVTPAMIAVVILVAVLYKRMG